MKSLYELNPFVRYVRALTIRNGEFPQFIVPYDCRLFYGLSGRGNIYFEAGVFDITPGTLMIWPSGMKYHMEPLDSNGMDILAVNYDLDAAHCDASFPIPPVREKLFDRSAMYEAPECVELPMKDTPIVIRDAYFCEAILRDMLLEYTQQKLLTREYLSAQMTRLLALSARCLMQPEARIDQILTYIHAHYSEPLSNETLGALFGFHPNSLNRLIVRHTGCSLHQYLLMYRLRQAIVLIESTALPISEIAEQVGIGDPGYFSKLFRRKTGRRPIDYRKS